jgi:hypothetical protein
MSEHATNIILSDDFIQRAMNMEGMLIIKRAFDEDMRSSKGFSHRVYFRTPLST